MTDGWDDDEFLAVLQQALSRRCEVPPEFVAAAKSAYTWRNIDVEAHARTDPETAIPTDEVGCFVIRPIPHSPFRLRRRAAASIDVLTSWLTLLHRLGPAPKQPADFERALRVFFDR